VCAITFCLMAALTLAGWMLRVTVLECGCVHKRVAATPLRALFSVGLSEGSWLGSVPLTGVYLHGLGVLC
jgi:hypothetical protein